MHATKSLLAFVATSLACLPGLAQDTAPAPAPATAPAVALEPAAPDWATPRADVPAALKVLVPDDAAVFGMTGSLTQLEDVIRSLVTDIQPEMAGMVSADMLLAMLPGLDPSAVDRSRPVGMAVGPITMGPEPQIYLLLPTSNPEAIKSILPDGGDGYATRSSEGYLGVTRGLEYGVSTGASSLLDSLPAGLVSINVDTETLLASFRPIIDFGLEAARMEIDSLSDELDELGTAGVDVAELMDTYFELLADFMDSVVELRISLDVDESLIDLRAEHAVAPDSPMANFASEKAVDVAGFLPLLGDDAFAMVMGADMGDLMSSMMPFMESMVGAYPEEFGAGLMASMTAMEDMYGMFGDVLVASGDLGPAGMQMSAYFDGARFDELLASYEGIVKESYWQGLGMTYVDTKKGRLGDVELTRFTFDYDLDALAALGGEEIPEEERELMSQLMTTIYGEQLVTTFAKVGDLGVLTLGTDDAYVQGAIERASAPAGRSPMDMQRLSGVASSSNPFLAYRMDLGRLMTSIMPLMEETMGMPSMGFEMYEGTSLPMNMYFGASTSQWTTGMMVDLIQIGDFMAMVMALEGQ